MNMRRLFVLSITATLWLSGFEHLRAATLQTFGTGSAAAVVDLSANFNSLTSVNIVHLDTYSEEALNIRTSGDSWAADFTSAPTLDPFHGANGMDRAFYAIAWGNNDWVTIETTNSSTMHGVEFMYGNTWTTGNAQYPWGNAGAILEWQTWKNQALVSSGAVGGVSPLQMGTVVGFYDPAGFDQLLVRATVANSGDPTLQAVAFDNLVVMLTNVPPTPAIYGSDFTLSKPIGIPTLSVYDTIAGCQYRLVFTEALAPTTWTPVTPPLPDGWQAGGGVLTFTDTNVVGKARCFYRVEVR